MVLFSFYPSDVVPRGAHEKLDPVPVEDGEASVKKSSGMSHRSFRLRGETPGSRKAKQLRAFAPNVLC